MPRVMRVAWIVAHPVGKFRQLRLELFAYWRIVDVLVERGVHAQQPGVALRRADGKTRMAHAQARMAARVRVVPGAAQPFAQIELQDSFRRAKVRGVHRADVARGRHRVHVPVKCLDQPVDGGRAADDVVDCRCLLVIHCHAGL